MFAQRTAFFVCLVSMGLIAPARAQEPTPGYHPWARDHVGPLEIDVPHMLAHPQRYIDVAIEPTHRDRSAPPVSGGRWVQRGGVMLPEAVASGEVAVDPEVAYAAEDVPGNEYPRKHTLFLNFNGGMLFTGLDNSAENRSSLATQGVYPAYEGGEQKALSIIQSVQDDLSSYGVSVVYAQRPPKVVPYTMEMIGGRWTDTNLESEAGGVAPGSDCGALGQRHVVYTFASGGTPTTRAANTASQEAGHAWGLDHTLNCNSVMSYCGSSNGVFSDTCDTFCDTLCQGPNSIGCRLTHEEFCGEQAEQQNEDAELTWLFGGNEPDIEPPTVQIVEPEDGLMFDEGADINVRSLVSDNYGGYSWYYVITQNGQERANFVDYDRQVDEQYRPALNLSDLEAGEWVITVGSEDHFGHTAQDTVTIIVGDITPGSTLDDSGGETLDDGTAGEGTDDDGPGFDDAAGGCACRTSASSPHALGAAGLLLWGLWGRRRRQ